LAELGTTWWEALLTPLNLGVAVAVAVLAGLCVMGAWSRLWRIQALLSVDVEALAERARGRAPAERARLLSEAAPEQSWERELGEALEQSRDDRDRLVSVNETLGALEHELGRGAGWPGASVAIAVAGGGAVMLAGWLLGAGWEIALSLLPLLASVVACAWARVASRRSEAKARKRVDALVDAVVGELGEVGDSARRPHRRRRWRRRGPSDPLQTRGPGTPFGLSG